MSVCCIMKKQKNCSNLQLLMKHELGNDCGSLLLVFVFLVCVLSGEWRVGGREGGREGGRITHMNKTISQVGGGGRELTSCWLPTPPCISGAPLQRDACPRQTVCASLLALAAAALEHASFAPCAGSAVCV